MVMPERVQTRQHQRRAEHRRGTAAHRFHRLQLPPPLPPLPSPLTKRALEVATSLPAGGHLFQRSCQRFPPPAREEGLLWKNIT